MKNTVEIEIGYAHLTFNGNDIYKIWEIANQHRAIILDKSHSTDNQMEKHCLVFTANCIGDLMDMMAELLEPSEPQNESFYCGEKYKIGYVCEDGQCDRCAKAEKY